MLVENANVKTTAKEKQRLLFIDDDPSILQSLKMILSDDYETYGASTVEEGLRLFSLVHPPVVILDLNMPVRGGMEAFREIRKLNASTAVIILTGCSTRLAAEESLRLGAADYINKPFVASELKARIAKVNLSRVLRQLEPTPPSEKEIAMAESMISFRELQNASGAFLHDVAGPLSCLMAGSDILSQMVSGAEKLSVDDVESVSTMMGDSVRYLRALVEQWRAFSDLHVLRRDKCDVQKAIDLAVSQVMELLSLSGVVFQIKYHGEARQVPGNHFALARVLINLIKNAYEAVSPLNGRILLTINVLENELQLVVSDDGFGVKPDQIPHLFTPRFTTKTVGRGFGLFISKKIVEAVDGKITVQSPGQMRGTDFIITLPLV